MLLVVHVDFAARFLFSKGLQPSTAAASGSAFLSKHEVGKANTNSRGAGAASGQSRSGITFLAGAQVPPQMWHLPAPDRHSKLPSDHSIMECQPCQPHTTRPKFSSTSIFSRSRRAIKPFLHCRSKYYNGKEHRREKLSNRSCFY